MRNRTDPHVVILLCVTMTASTGLGARLEPSATEPAGVSPDTLAPREERLLQHLVYVGAEIRSQRYAGVAQILVLAGTMVAASLLVPESGTTAITAITGGVLLGVGVLTLSRPANEELLVTEFAQMRRTSVEEREKRLADFEDRFRRTAAGARTLRIVGGSLAAALGLGYGALVLAVAPPDPLVRWTNLMLLGVPLVSSAAYILFLPSPAERAWSLYSERAVSLTVGVGATVRRTPLLGLSGRFQ
jgi:hypothetical protein